MITSTYFLGATAFAASVFAQTATITIEASHGGAGSDLTNTTITVPIGVVYTNSSALDEVSYLFLTGAEGVPVDSITCTPYISANGTGSGGLPFNSTSPSYLSTNTVQVGSIVCRTSGSGSSSPSASSSLSSSSSSSSAVATSTTLSPSSNWTMSASASTTESGTSSTAPTLTPSPPPSYIPLTSTYITYVTPSGATTARQSTVTSIYHGEASPSSSNANGQSDAASVTSSAAPSVQSNENHADQLASSPYTFAAIGFGLLGVAFWL
ncbi:hypothetical protein K431DRAFT_280783 [Polychaeton citri CBS 116435]|uniref:Uncharacterized protein n=1 Tax=Polychaeton citri CBS 116435 TaxID=1314669 RepID=A0A9P4QGM5_9PEZI|nr:hypothetical protein K431DRAFT_280783 [Polychaeton citri CBS 116435]